VLFVVADTRDAVLDPGRTITTSPSLQFGTALANVGGSAADPSAKTILKLNIRPPFRVGGGPVSPSLVARA
jgi:hypothetical protein